MVHGTEPKEIFLESVDAAQIVVGFAEESLMDHEGRELICKGIDLVQLVQFVF
jgi:hypothetical protein